MPENIVSRWFGETFSSLHPLLQQLHTDGGTLAGDVEIAYGSGLSGVLGRRLAKKMNLPGAGVHRLKVDISHDSAGLHWGRSFNNQTLVYSLFRPVGTIGHGYWIEQTGPLEMKLTVDVDNGGWYWRCLKVSFMGLPIPLWLVPGTEAYKTIDDGKYRFHVQFSLPVLGRLVSYSGLLDAGPVGASL